MSTSMIIAVLLNGTAGPIDADRMVRSLAKDVCCTSVCSRCAPRTERQSFPSSKNRICAVSVPLCFRLSSAAYGDIRNTGATAPPPYPSSFRNGACVESRLKHRSQGTGIDMWDLGRFCHGRRLGGDRIANGNRESGREIDLRVLCMVTDQHIRNVTSEILARPCVVGRESVGSFGSHSAQRCTLYLSRRPRCHAQCVHTRVDCISGRLVVM